MNLSIQNIILAKADGYKREQCSKEHLQPKIAGERNILSGNELGGKAP